MKTLTKLTLGAAMWALLLGAPAFALDEITVGYFLEWPMPFQYAKVKKIYDEEVGVKVNWMSFETGTAMSAAMASGDVQIGVSQGLPPFIVAASAGQDLHLLDVAVSYSENNNCVVRSDLEIDQDSTDELAGRKVALPLGSTAHYDFLKQMIHFGVDPADLDIVDMAPPDGAAALSQGNVDMACGWGGSLRRMKQHGNVLLTGAEKEAAGILSFDVTAAPASFVAENSDLVADFLKVTADVNAMWNSGENTAEMLPVIARDAGMDEDAAAETLAAFVFPDVDAQLSGKWLGGGGQEFMKSIADLFAKAGSIDNVLDSYDNTVNTGPLRAVSGL